jgi:hypothetical protein
MLRFIKISLLVVHCGVAILVALPAAHAEPQIQLVLNGVPQLTPPITGINGVVNFGILVNGVLQPLPVGRFMVSLTGTSNSPGGTQGTLQLMGTVTGGHRLDRLKIQLTDTGFTQKGKAIFAETVQGTITGKGSIRFQAFLDKNNLPFGGLNPTGPFLPVLGPYVDPKKDASYSGSGSEQVTDTSPSSTTSESTVTGGDATFTYVVTNRER